MATIKGVEVRALIKSCSSEIFSHLNLVNRLVLKNASVLGNLNSPVYTLCSDPWGVQVVNFILGGKRYSHTSFDSSRLVL